MKDEISGYHSLPKPINSESFGTSGYSSLESSQAFQSEKSNIENYPTSGSITSQNQYIYNYPKVANIILPAIELTDKIENGEIRGLVLQFLTTFQSVLVDFLVRKGEIGYLPPLKLTCDEDGSALLEWLFKDFRIGISFEANIAESSWYLLSNANMQELSESGLISSVDLKTLILKFVDYVVSNT